MSSSHVDESIEVSGLTVHCLRGGTGQPIVMFHHSFGNPGWLELHSELAREHEVLVPDLPGFGESERPDWARHPRDLALLMGHWLDRQALGSVPLVGCGFGGWVAAELATMSPARLSHLVLVGAAGLLPKQGHIMDQMLISHSAYVQASFKDESAYRALYGEEPTDDLLLAWDVHREMVTRVAWKPYMYNRRLRPLLPEVGVPTLVVWGAEDAVIPLDCGQQYAEAIPDARLEVVVDTGHAVDLENPGKLGPLVLEQLNHPRMAGV